MASHTVPGYIGALLKDELDGMEAEELRQINRQFIGREAVVPVVKPPTPTPKWVEPPPIPEPMSLADALKVEIADMAGDMSKQVRRQLIGPPARGTKAEMNGLRNIVAGASNPGLEPLTGRPIDFKNGSKFSYYPIDLSGLASAALKYIPTSEEDPMYSDNDQCCASAVPAPEPAKTTLKRLRKQAKALRKEITDVKKQAKRNKAAEKAARARAEQRETDRETAIQALRDAANGYATRDQAIAAGILIDKLYL